MNKRILYVLFTLLYPTALASIPSLKLLSARFIVRNIEQYESRLYQLRRSVQLLLEFLIKYKKAPVHTLSRLVDIPSPDLIKIALESELISGIRLMKKIINKNAFQLFGWLLSNQCFTINSQDQKTKNTSLHYAVLANEPAYVELLLRYGAATDIVNCYDRTPLDLALQHNYSVIVELLRQHAPNSNRSVTLYTASIEQQESTISSSPVALPLSYAIHKKRCSVS